MMNNHKVLLGDVFEYGKLNGLVWLGWVWFYSLLSIVGYVMPNPLYTYILDIYDLVW